MTLHLLPIPAPVQAQDFEHLCLALFKRLWNDDHAQLFGVSGQNQSGIDIVGRPNGGTEVHAVQCKVRAGPSGRLAFSDVIDDVGRADKMQSSLDRLIVATTARRDANLQVQILALTRERVAEGKFPVIVMAWEDLSALLAAHKDIARRHFPDFFVNERHQPHDESGLRNKAPTSQRSARLRVLFNLLNDGCGTDGLTISEIAEQLQLEKVSHLENYFSGVDEPPIALLKELADLFCVNFEWLLHGKGAPFYHLEPFFFEAQESLSLIRSTEPEQVFFVRSSSEHGECVVVLKYNDWKYHCLSILCHVSAHVGATGSSQLLSLFRLIDELSKPSTHLHCVGETLKPDEFDKLLNGEYFPGSILGRRDSRSLWWDALLDIDYKHFTEQRYQEWYGKALVDAHRVIREQKAKVA